ncbi:MAG: hypothetical protein WC156_12360, partial [Pedobacter sp.]
DKTSACKSRNNSQFGYLAARGCYAATKPCAVKDSMQTVGRKTVSQFLGTIPVVNVDKGIVGHFVTDSIRCQHSGKPVMSVAVKLKTKRAPCRNAKIDKSQLFILKIEVVMKAFTRL